MDSTRTSERTVTFTKPFELDEWDEVLPAGVYTVETEEELFEGVAVRAWRRMRTLIHLPQPGTPGAWQTLPIDPRNLEVALLRDTGAQLVEPAPES